MQTGSDAMTYTWHDNWATLPDTPSAKENGRTHGVCVADDGRVIVFCQAENGLVHYDADGKLIEAFGGDRWVGAHGLTKIHENGEEFLWLVDQTSKEVAKTTLAGETVMTIAQPDHPAYHGEDAKGYVPTWAAQDPDRGDIWVANGYGSHLVHHYNKDGDYLDTLEGSQEAGAFREPHGVNFTRGADGQPELWVTDRASHQIQVFDGEGAFLRASKSCHSPCCFDFLGDQVLVPELFTGAKVIDRDSLEVVAHVGANDAVAPNADPSLWWPPKAPEGWPDLAGTDHVKAGLFNSPHGGCFAPNGDIYIVEWIVGGRITKLAKA